MKKTILLLFTALLAFGFAKSEEKYDNLVDVSIASNMEQIQIGADFYVIVKLNINGEWHVYWKNPGDSGLPTHIEWNTPKGVEKVGELIWQVPKRIEFSGMINYGLEDEVYLLQKFTTVRNSIKLNKIKIKADVSWLVCKDICIPQDESVSIELAVGDKFKKSNSDGLVNELLASAPMNFKSPNSTFEIDEEVSIELKDRPADLATVTDIYLITEGIIDNTKPVEIENESEEIEAEMSVSPYIDTTPAELELLVLYMDKNGKNKSYETIIQNK